MNSCPPIDALEGLARGLLAPDHAVALTRHTAGCPSCAALLATVRDNLALEESVSAALRSPTTPARTGPLGIIGRSIGVYRVNRVLGSGGSSTVYEATDASTGTAVAIKVLSPFAATGEHARRFSQEATLLAQLTHPGISRVITTGCFDDDAGARPYLVMELVRGQPITRHCESLRMTVPDRLALLAQACDAVHYAHTIGIIHRDLKPANILVTGDGHARVIDFGVARGDTPSTTMHTATGQVVGTIAYMSPEHIAGATNADAGSDIYSLGVIAYELTTGEPPFALAGASLQAAVRLITLMDPARPSASPAFTQLTRASSTLPADIDTVILRALEKDPRDRYATAGDFADDLRRLSLRLPAHAKPPGVFRRSRRFARRHRSLTLSAVAVLGALLMGLAGTTFGLVRALERERLAESRRRDTEQLASLLESMLRQAHPHEDKGRGYTVRQMLDDFASRFQSQNLQGQPEVEASLRTTIGTGYRVLGEYTLARPHLQRALNLRRAALPPDAPVLARATEDLAMLDHDEGKYDSAIARFAEAAATAPDATDIRVRALLGQSDCHRHQGDFTPARTLARQAVATATGNSLLAAEAHLNLSRVLRDAGEYDAAQPEFDEAMRAFTSLLPGNDPRTADALNDGAWLLFLRRHLPAAHDTAAKALNVGTASLGDNHPDVANSLYELALITSAQGDSDEAIVLLRRAISIYQSAHGDTHVSTFTAKEALARVLRTAERPGEALPLLQDVLSARRETLGERNVEVAYALSALGLVQHDLHDNDSAARSLTQAVDIYEATYHKPHPFTAGALRDLSAVDLDRADMDAALEHARAAVGAFESVLGEQHADTLAAMAQLANVLESREQWNDALATHEHICARRTPSTPPFRATLALQGRARCLVHLGRAAEGLPLLREAVDQFAAQASTRASHAATLRLDHARRDLAEALNPAMGVAPH